MRENFGLLKERPDRLDDRAAPNARPRRALMTPRSFWERVDPQPDDDLGERR